MKKFNKIFALLLAIITVLATLPIAAVTAAAADAWAKVEADTVTDADTGNSATTVTLTVDAGVLADLLKEKGLSADLLAGLKDGIEFSADELLQIFTLEELFRIIPKERWLDIFVPEQVIAELGGISAVQGYVDSTDYPVLMESILEKPNAAEELATLLGYISNLEDCVNPIILLEKGYLEPTAENIAENKDIYDLIEEHLVDGAESKLVDMLVIDDELKALLNNTLNSYNSLDEIEEFVKVEKLIMNGLIAPSSVLKDGAMQTIREALDDYIHHIHETSDHTEFQTMIDRYIGQANFATLRNGVVAEVKTEIMEAAEEKVEAAIDEILDNATTEDEAINAVKAVINSVLDGYIDYFAYYGVTVTFDYNVTVDALNRTYDVAFDEDSYSVVHTDDAELFQACWEKGWIHIDQLIDADGNSQYVADMEGLLHFFLFDATDANGDHMVALDEVADLAAEKAAASALINDDAKLAQLLDPANGYIDYAKALKAIGFEVAVEHIPGGYETILNPSDPLLDVAGLIAEINLQATLDNIMGDETVDFNTVVYVDVILSELEAAGKSAELVSLVDTSVLVGLLTNQELFEIIQKLDLKKYIKSVAAMALGQILEYIDKVEIDGVTVAEESTEGARQLRIYAQKLLEVLIDKIPDIDELLAADFDGTVFSMDIAFDYTVADTNDPDYNTTKSKSICLNVVLGGNIAKFQEKLQALKTNLYDIYINELKLEGMNLTLDLNMTPAFAEVFKQIINDESLSLELRQKIAQLGESSDNIFAFVGGDLTLGNIGELLDAIDVNKLYDVIKSAGYTQIVLEKYDAFTGSSFSEMSADELLNYIVTTEQTLEDVCNAIKENTGRNLLPIIEKAASVYDKAMNKAEQIAAVNKILNAVESRVGINISDISAEEILNNNVDTPIVDRIFDAVMAKFGRDLEGALANHTAQELYDLAVAKALTYEARINAVIEKVQALFDKLSEKELNLCIRDYYQGGGTFNIELSKSYNPTALIEKVVGALLSRLNVGENALNTIMNAFADEPNATVHVNFTLQLTNVYSIEFYSRNADENAIPLYTAFLPVGADLSIFENNETVTGYKFTGWAAKDADGNWVDATVMADHDMKVYADGNATEVTFKAPDGTVLGAVMLPFGETLGGYENGTLLAAIEALIDTTPENAYVSGDYTIHWMNNGVEIDPATATFGVDTVLVYELRPDYHLDMVDQNGNSIDYTVEEENGAYTLTITDPNWTPANGLDLALNDGLLEHAKDNVNVTLTVGDANSPFSVTFDNNVLRYVANNKRGVPAFHYGTGYHNEINEGKSQFDDKLYDESKVNAASAPEYHSFKLNDTYVMEGETVVADLGNFNEADGGIFVTVAYLGGMSENRENTHVYTMDDSGKREMVEITAIDYAAETLTFKALHFSDFVILNEYKVGFKFFTEEGFIVDATVADFDEANPYYPAGHVINFAFNTASPYNKVVSVVDGDNNPYTDSYTVEGKDVTLTVTLTGGVYYVYYYVGDTLWATKEYNKNDVSVIEANGKSAAYNKTWVDFATLIADTAVVTPAGFNRTGAWVGYDEAALGSKNLVVSAKWNVIETQYKISFMAGETEVSSVNITTSATTAADILAAANITALPAVPAKTGYTGAWDLNGAVLSGTTVTVSAVYTVDSFSIVADGNVTLKDNAGNAIDTTKDVPFGTEITVEAIAKEHYDAAVSVILSTKDADGKDVPVEVKDGKFTMPAETVYISVTYTEKTYTYTFAGVTGSAKYGQTVYVTVTVPAGKAINEDSVKGLTFVSETKNAEGLRVFTYAFVVNANNMVFTPTFRDLTARDILYIFNGMLFGTNLADGTYPETDVKNVQVDGWSDTVWDVLRFANISLINPNLSLLWLWILLAVLLFIAIIATVYLLHIKGKIKTNFFVRFAVWVVSVFFAICRGVAFIGLKIAYLFGKSDIAEDYGFTEVPAEEAVEEAVEEETEEVEADEEVAETATESDEAVEEVAEETVVEEATEEAAVAEVVDEVVAEAVEEEAAKEAAEAPAQATENEAEEAIAIVVEDEAVEADGEATEETAEEATEEVAEEATEEVAEEATEEVVEEATEEVVEEATEEVAEEATEEVAEEATEEVAEETTVEVEEDTAIAIEEETEVEVEAETEAEAEEATEEAIEIEAEESEAVTEEVVEEATEEVTEEATEEVAQEATEEVAETADAEATDEEETNKKNN